MYKALILGCGNIGAMYDFETDSVSTYAKTFHLDKAIEFEVYDIDQKVAEKVASRYGVRSLPQLNPALYQNYDIIVISTPTSTHHEYLYPLLKRGPRLIICEKPVDSDPARLGRLAEIYRTSNTKVMVNYFRRFQPGIIQLKHRIEAIQRTEPCRNIIATYQRGFHNNASHAVDLLEFLFSSTINFKGAHVSHRAFDEFSTDPTLSLSCVWNGANLQFIGLEQAAFSRLEIALYFSRKALLLRDDANTIEELSAPAKNGCFYPKLELNERQTGVLDRHMINVVSHAKRILTEKALNDNFLESISLSERMLKVLSD